MRTAVLIDNEVVLAVTFRVFLEEADYSVHIAEDSKTALSLCRSKQPDIIVSHLNGSCDAAGSMQLVPQLRKEFPDTPIVTMSGALEPEMGHKMLKAGASHHVLKPVSGKSLVGLIEDLLNSRGLCSNKRDKHKGAGSQTQKGGKNYVTCIAS